MVFPSCSSVSSAGVDSGCIINIVYNEQLPLCSSVTSPTTDKEENRICRSCALLTRTSSSLCAQEAITMLVTAHVLYSLPSIIYYAPGIRTGTTLRPSFHLPRELSSRPRYHILSSPTFAHQAWRRKPGWLAGPPIYRLQSF